MTFPTSSTFVAGAVLTAAQLNALRADLIATDGYVAKTADQSVTSSIVLVNDTHLTYTIGAVGTYLIDCYLYATSAANAAGDLALGFTFPTGTMYGTALGPDTGLLSGNIQTAQWGANVVTSGAATWQAGLSTSLLGIWVHASLTATATGTLRLQWAQQNSSASASTLKIGSHMTVRQVA